METDKLGDMGQRIRKSELLTISLLAVILLLILFHRSWLGAEWLSGGDLVNNYIPYKSFLRTWIHQGIIPLWNPHIFGGRPFAADIQLGLFYPPNWLFFFLNPEFGFTILTLAHLLLAALSMYLFIRLFCGHWAAIWGAIVFTFSAFFVTRLYGGLVLFIFTASWIPLIFYLATRGINEKNWKFALWLGLALAMQLLAGSPQVAFYTWYALTLYALFQLILFLTQSNASAADRNIVEIPIYREKKDKGFLSVAKPLFWIVKFYLIALVVMLGLSAMQILPTWQFIAYSFERAGGAPWEYATTDSLTLRLFLTWLFPDIFYYPTSPGIYWGAMSGYWEINAYLGVAPLWLGLIAVLLCFYRAPLANKMSIQTQPQNLTKFLLVLAIISLLLAFGRYSPLYKLLYYLLPGFNSFRAPARTCLFYIFSVSTLSALGLEMIIRHLSAEPRMLNARLKKWLYIFLGVVAVTAIFLLANWAIIMKWLGINNLYGQQWIAQNPELYASILRVGRNSVATTIILSLAVLTLVLLFLHGRITNKRFACFLMALLLGDLILFGVKFVNTAPAKEFREQIYPRTELISILSQGLNGARFCAVNDVYSWLNDQNQMEIYPNRAMMRGLDDARGYDPIFIRSYAEVFNLLGGREPKEPPGALLQLARIESMQLLSMLNIKYILTYSRLKELPLIKSFPFGLNVYENPEATGPAYLALPKLAEASSQQQHLQLLIDPDIDPTKYAVVNIDSLSEQEKASWTTAAALSESTTNIITPQKVSQQDANPNRQIYQVSLDRAAVLVFSENYYPGWKVYMDGENKPLVRVNHTLCGVLLSPGNHEVVKVFRPAIFYVGLIVSSLSLIILLALILIPHRTRQHIS